MRSPDRRHTLILDRVNKKLRCQRRVPQGSLDRDERRLHMHGGVLCMELPPARLGARSVPCVQRHRRGSFEAEARPRRLDKRLKLRISKGSNMASHEGKRANVIEARVGAQQRETARAEPQRAGARIVSRRGRRKHTKLTVGPVAVSWAGGRLW